ncbi:MAG: efflux RND transporter periplasmic adaptor subunit [bacterium]|nr:efflux RND transporter periplasmic adaptor subunit [bacterium]
MKTIKQVILLMLPLIFCLILSGCSDSGKSSKSGPLAITVQTKNVISKDVPNYINAFGKLKAYQSVEINPMISGQITQILFTPGMHVNKGQLLATLDTMRYEAALLNDESVLEGKEAELKLKDYIVTKEKNAAAHFAIARQKYEADKTDLAVARADVKTQKIKIMSDKINLDYCYIKAPISGVVGEKMIDAGNVISTTDILTDIQNNDLLYVDFSLPGSNTARLKRAINSGKSKVIVTVNRLNEYGISKKIKYTGTLKFINNQFNANTGTISLEALVTNKDNYLLPGQFVNLKIILNTIKSAILIPTAAIQLGPTGQYVYKVSKKNKAEMVKIVTGETFPGYSLLAKGKLTSKDRVIITGFQELAPFSLVKVENVKIDKKTVKKSANKNLKTKVEKK